MKVNYLFVGVAIAILVTLDLALFPILVNYHVETRKDQVYASLWYEENTTERWYIYAELHRLFSLKYPNDQLTCEANWKLQYYPIRASNGTITSYGTELLMQWLFYRIHDVTVWNKEWGFGSTVFNVVVALFCFAIIVKTRQMPMNPSITEHVEVRKK